MKATIRVIAAAALALGLTTVWAGEPTNIPERVKKSETQVKAKEAEQQHMQDMHKHMDDMHKSQEARDQAQEKQLKELSTQKPAPKSDAGK